MCSALIWNITPPQVSVLVSFYESDNGYNHARNPYVVQGGSNMTGTDLCVNKPHCAAAVRP